METALMQFIQWSVKSGILPAGTAVILVVFCFLVIWAGKKQSRDFQSALKAQKEANTETCMAIREQVEQQGKHIEGCEKRYEQLRADMNLVQRQVGETHETIWREVLSHLRGK